MPFVKLVDTESRFSSAEMCFSGKAWYDATKNPRLVLPIVCTYLHKRYNIICVYSAKDNYCGRGANYKMQLHIILKRKGLLTHIFHHAHKRT